VRNEAGPPLLTASPAKTGLRNGAGTSQRKEESIVDLVITMLLARILGAIFIVLGVGLISQH
jgi:hypothetical protein